MDSYAKGPEATLLEITIGEQLRRTAERFPDHPAVASFHQGVRLTWQELDALADEWARGLMGMGLRPEDRVGLWSTNCVEWIALQMACARAGLVLVNVNPAYRSHDLGFVLRKSGMKAIFLWEKDARANYREILEEAAEGLPGLAAVYFGEGFGWKAEAEAGYRGSPGDICNIQYTSGTTGKPKGVMLTHRNLVNNGLLIGQQMKITPEDRLCVPVPLYHCFGSVIGVMTALAHGCAVVLPSWSFDTGATLRAIQEGRATAIYGVPTMFISELEHPEFAKFDLSSLRTGVMAGAPCPIEVMRRVASEMHCPEMTIAYGMTESSPVVTMSPVDAPLELRVSTIGAVMPATEMQVVSPGTGKRVPIGEQGELCARGYMIMRGYDGEKEATSNAIDGDGWLHTGDLGVMREDGYLRITGRAKDMIIRGGENIYPREVEEFLYLHPKIADVQVVGVPDAKLGQTLAAWVRLKTGESLTGDELRTWCQGKVAYFKIPQYIRFVDSFPMTLSGKAQKYRMREIEVEALGLSRKGKAAMA